MSTETEKQTEQPMLTETDSTTFTTQMYATELQWSPVVITGVDSDSDGKPNSVPADNDFDLDGIENWKDIDADNDGIVDNIEAQTSRRIHRSNRIGCR